MLSFTDVIVKSSNVGAIKVGLQLGPQRLGMYARRFGFGRGLSPDFPGEASGILWDPAKLDSSALASMSMGYQVGVTALQMVSAVSAVANGGELIQPRVVRALIPRRPALRREAHRPGPRDHAGHRRHADRHHGAGGGAGHRHLRRRLTATRSREKPAPRTSSKTAVTHRPTSTRRLSASCRLAIRWSRSSSCWIPRTRTGISAGPSPARSSRRSRKRRFAISASRPRSTRRLR